MLRLTDYLDTAKARRDLKSDYELAKLLGVTKQYVSDLRKGRALPGDELMVKIATCADTDGAQALMHLCYWKARHGRAKAIYKDLYERLAGASLALALGFTALSAPTPSRAPFSENPLSVYYGKQS